MDSKKIMAVFMVFLILTLPVFSAESINGYYFKFSKVTGEYISGANNDYSFSSNGIGVFSVYTDSYQSGSSFQIQGVPVLASNVNCNDATKTCILEQPMTSSEYAGDFSPRVSIIKAGSPTLSAYLPNGASLIFDDTKPSFVSYDVNTTVRPPTNATFSFVTRDSKISYVKINDRYVLVNRSGTPNSGNYKFDIQIPVTVYGAAGGGVSKADLSISLVDMTGNEGMPIAFTVFIDDKAPEKVMGINFEGYDDVASYGPFIVKDNKYYDISSPDQMIVPLSGTFRMAMCFSDMSYPLKAYGNFATLGSSTYSNVLGSCVLDNTKTLCEDANSYKCTFDFLVQQSSMCDADGNCARSFSINVSDKNGKSSDFSSDTTYSFNSKFFNNAAPLDPSVSLTIWDYGVENTLTYFYSGEVHKLKVSFAPTELVNDVYVSKTTVTSVKDMTSQNDWKMIKVTPRQADPYFILDNFSFDTSCSRYCNISLYYTKILSSGDEISARWERDVSSKIDKDAPGIMKLNINLINSTSQTDFRPFDGNIYFSSSSIGAFRLDLTDAKTGFTNKTVSLSIDSKTFPMACSGTGGANINTGYCVFSSVLPSDLTTLISSRSSLKIKACDLANNCNETDGSLLISSSANVVNDVTAPTLSSTEVVHVPLSSSKYQDFIINGDTLFFNINVTEFQSGISFAKINVSGLCEREEINLQCTNQTPSNYECKTPTNFACRVATSAFGPKQYRYNISDGAGNSFSNLITVDVKELGTSVVDCINDEPFNQNDKVQVPQFVMYNGPPALRHTFNLGLKSSASSMCGTGGVVSSDIKLEFVSVICELNKNDVDTETYGTDAIKVYPSEITYSATTADKFVFDLKMHVLSTEDRGSVIFNTTSFPFECNATFSLLVKNKINSQETVLLKVNYTYVDMPDADIATQADLDKINEIKTEYAQRSGNEIWALVTDLEKIIEYAETWCQLGSTVKQVISIVQVLGSTFALIGENQKGTWWGTAAEAVGKVLNVIQGKVGKWVTGQASNSNFSSYKILTDEEGRVRWGWEGKGSLGGIACAISSCGGDSMVDVSEWFGQGSTPSNICKYVTQFMAGAYVDNLVNNAGSGSSSRSQPSGTQPQNGGSLPSGIQTAAISRDSVTGYISCSSCANSDNPSYCNSICTNDPASSTKSNEEITNDIVDSVSSAQFAKSNFIASIACLCIPGIIYNINKYRQIQCKLGYCLQNMTVLGGVDTGQCYGLHAVETCDWWAGDIINSLWSSLNIDELFNNIFDMLNNPLASMMAGFKDGATCYADDGSLDTGQCNDQAKNAFGGGSVLSQVATGIFKTNYIQKGTSIGMCYAFCTTSAGAVLGSLLAAGLETWEYVVYLKNNDITSTEFWFKEGETNKMDWCDALMGNENAIGGSS